MNNNSKIAAATVIAVALGGSTLAAGVAGAALQDDTDPTLTEEETTVVEAPADGDVNADDETNDRGQGRRGPRGARSEVLADVLGVDAEILRTAIQGGDSIADVADANGVDIQVVIDTLVAERNTRLQSAVDEGRITPDEAAEKAANIEERITAKVNGTFEGRDGNRRGHRHNGPNADTGAETDVEIETPGGS